MFKVRFKQKRRDLTSLEFTSSWKRRWRHTNNGKWMMSFQLLRFWIWNHSSSLFRIKNSIEKSKKVTLTKNNMDVSNLGFFTMMRIQAYGYRMHVLMLTGMGDAGHSQGISWNDQVPWWCSLVNPESPMPWHLTTLETRPLLCCAAGDQDVSYWKSIWRI